MKPLSIAVSFAALLAAAFYLGHRRMPGPAPAAVVEQQQPGAGAPELEAALRSLAAQGVDVEALLAGASARRDAASARPDVAQEHAAAEGLQAWMAQFGATGQGFEANTFDPRAAYAERSREVQEAFAAQLIDYYAAALQAQALGYTGYAGGWGGGSPADPYLGGSFYGNGNLGTAVSSSGGSGYIALGDGDFVSW